MQVNNIIYGRIPVLEALRSDLDIEKIFVLFGTHGKNISEIYRLAKQKGVKIVQLDRKKFSEVSEIEHSQGVVAIITPIKFNSVDFILKNAEEKKEKNFILILDEIQDPQNLGAIIRTADCVGVHGIIIPKHNAVSITSTVIKASAGAAEYFPVAKVGNIAQTIDELKQNGIWIVGTDSSADKFYNEMKYDFPVALVIGSEGKGIRRLVKEKCDFLVKIPLYGRVDSLNASVAAGIVLYEIKNQRLKL